MNDDLPLLSFASKNELDSWLAKQPASSTGTWIRLFKKQSGVRTVTHAEALDVALCYGWIDGQKKPYDTESWLQRFTPRKPKSKWSKRNRAHIERLEKLGELKPAGIQQIAAAKADGRWEQAYDAPSNTVVPADFLRELAKNEKAETFFKTLNKANVYAIAWRLQTAKKSETREKRLKAMIAMLANEKKFHP